MAGTYSRKTELLVVGGGPGGYVAAIRAGQLGRKVLLVEKDQLGGECLNRGCIPSKALIHAALLYDRLRTQGPEIGVEASGLRFDLAKAQRWKEAVVAKERQGVGTLLKSAGVEVLRAEARFTGPQSAEVVAPDGGHERVDFDQAIIAVGAVPMNLPGFEPDGSLVRTSWQLLALTELPESVVVLGGGVSGCELGEFLAQVGVKVTIVELMPQLLPGLEPEIVRELSGALSKLGVDVHTNSRATALVRESHGIRLTATSEGKSIDCTGDFLFVTVGKRPATADLGLLEAGVVADPKSGFIGVDAQMRTNVPTIFAVGDCARPPMLAHKAYREGTVAAEAASARPTRFDFQSLPSVVFTTPELASVGFSIEEAKRHGIAQPREVRFPYAALGRAHANHATAGWIKIVGDDATGLFLGAHAVGESSGEFVAEAGLAIEMGATVRDLAMTIHPHPTFSEVLEEAALLWLGEPMHVARRSGVARPG